MTKNTRNINKKKLNLIKNIKNKRKNQLNIRKMKDLINHEMSINLKNNQRYTSILVNYHPFPENFHNHNLYLVIVPNYNYKTKNKIMNKCILKIDYHISIKR